MRKKSFFILFIIILTIGFTRLESGRALSAQPNKIDNLEPFKNTGRILILAPHPDDEAIGCAGVIQEALKASSRANAQDIYNYEE